MSKFSFFSMRYLLVTFDGCSYSSMHSHDVMLCYDYNHVNSEFTFFVSDLEFLPHSVESFIECYAETLLEPFEYE